MRPIVRSATSDGPATNDPPGTSMFWRVTALRTLSTDRPYALSRSAFSSSWISRLRSPIRLTDPTSFTVSSACFTFLSAISVSSFRSRGLYTAKLRIGAASGSIFWMFSGRVSRGNWLTTPASLSRTSWTAVSMSRSSVNVIVTRALPWSDDARSSSMPLIVLTASSMRLVICVSISSALAPGSIALTFTTGLSVFGIRSRPRDVYDTAPSTMSAAVIMMAKTGRLTLTSDRIIDALLHHVPGLCRDRGVPRRPPPARRLRRRRRSVPSSLWRAG